MNANFDPSIKNGNTFGMEHRVTEFGHRATESREIQSCRILKRRPDMELPARAFVHFVIFCSNSVDRFPSPTIGVYWRNSVKTSDGLLSFPSWLERSNFGPLSGPLGVQISDGSSL